MTPALAKGDITLKNFLPEGMMSLQAMKEYMRLVLKSLPGMKKKDSHEDPLA
jgi:hypothetical protein